MHTYHLSDSGKRTILALLVGTLVIWAFALWTFRSTIGSVAGEPDLAFFAALGRNLSQGLSIGQIIPALLTLGLIVATPLVFWNLIAEYAASYTTAEQGLAYRTIGINLLIPWAAINGIRGEEPASERGHKLLIDQDLTQQIGHSIVRLLYRSAYSRMELPIHAGLIGREMLLAEITERTGLTYKPEEQGVVGNEAT